MANLWYRGMGMLYIQHAVPVLPSATWVLLATATADTCARITFVELRKHFGQIADNALQL
jgi:hypothetical protein